MKKISVLTLVLLVSMSGFAFATDVAPGQSASCTDAKSINIEVDTIPNKSSGKYGFTDNDRGTASLVVWKSSNFTSVPISLGPNDYNTTVNGMDHGKTGIGIRGEKGRNVFVLTQQSFFSRGDSIGDISGLVRITNTGTNPVRVICN